MDWIDGWPSTMRLPLFHTSTGSRSTPRMGCVSTEKNGWAHWRRTCRFVTGTVTAPATVSGCTAQQQYSFRRLGIGQARYRQYKRGRVPVNSPVYTATRSSWVGGARLPHAEYTLNLLIVCSGIL